MADINEPEPEHSNLVVEEVRIEKKTMIAPQIIEDPKIAEIAVPSASKPVKCFNRFIIQSSPLMRNSLFNMIILFIFLSLIVWVLLFIIFDAQALPGGIYFSLLVLLICGHVFGYLFEKIKLPSLLGMLLVGIFFKNVPGVKIIGTSINSDVSSLLRNVAFCIILCRAGLSLHIESLFKLKWKIAKFSSIPCIVEACTVGVVSKFMLNIPFTWSFLLGFLLAGVSPAVVVPMMIELKELRLGTGKNIPTLIIAASCLYNIIAITGFTLLFDVTFSQGAIWWTLIMCALQILLGLVYGVVIAIFLSLFRIGHRLSLVSLRFTSLFIMSLIALLGSKKYGLTSAGPWGVLVLSILSKRLWYNIDMEKRNHKQTSVNDNVDKIDHDLSRIAEFFTKTWMLIFSPLMFTLIGNEINFMKIDPNSIGWGVAIVLIGLVMRTIASFFSLTFSGFNFKEKLFASLSWIPKATVQAAVGSMALDLARERKNDLEITRGSLILNLAVLSIILTAPLGTCVISLTSRRLLKKEEDME